MLCGISFGGPAGGVEIVWRGKNGWSDLMGRRKKNKIQKRVKKREKT